MVRVRVRYLAGFSGIVSLIQVFNYILETVDFDHQDDVWNSGASSGHTGRASEGRNSKGDGRQAKLVKNDGTVRGGSGSSWCWNLV